MHKVSVGTSVGVIVGNVVKVGLLATGVYGSVFAAEGMTGVKVMGCVIETDVVVGVGVDEVAPNTAPTISRFANVLTARTIPMIRRNVSRMQIFFSQCMPHLLFILGPLIHRTEFEKRSLGLIDISFCSRPSPHSAAGAHETNEQDQYDDRNVAFEGNL